jgi:hypothetical protein
MEQFVWALTIFVLALLLGYELITKVPPSKPARRTATWRPN